MPTPHTIINKPVPTLTEFKKIHQYWKNDVEKFQGQPIATNLVETAKHLGGFLYRIATTELQGSRQHTGDGGTDYTPSFNLIYLQHHTDAIANQLENRANLKTQKPKFLINSKQKIENNKNNTQAVLKGYQTLKPVDVAFYSACNVSDDYGNQAARDLINVMCYNLNSLEGYSTNESWVEMANAVLGDNNVSTEPTTQLSLNNYNQKISATFTQMLALHFLVSKANNKEKFGQELWQLFSNFFNNVQNRTTNKIDWQTTKATLQTLKTQVLEEQT